jgi:hypothetical protein
MSASVEQSTIIPVYNINTNTMLYTTNGKITFTFNATSNDYNDLNVYDTFGQKVYVEDVLQTIGINNVSFNFGYLTRGVYCLEFIYNSSKSIKRFIISY